MARENYVVLVPMNTWLLTQSPLSNFELNVRSHKMADRPTGLEGFGFKGTEVQIVSADVDLA